MGKKPPKGRKGPKNASRGIAWVFLGTGLGGILAASFMLAAAWQSLSWPTVQGSISSSRVTKTSSKLTRYGVGVTYSYWVEGRLYWGEVYSHSSDTLPGSFRNEDEALKEYASHALFRQWQRGRPVTVHYDPQDPSESVLRAGSTIGGWAAFVASIGLIAIGFYELARFKRQSSASGNGS
jgi:hypothetical protein